MADVITHLLHILTIPLADAGFLLDQRLKWLIAGVFVVAFLYSSVGHAGALGDTAVMSLSAVILRPAMNETIGKRGM